MTLVRITPPAALAVSLALAKQTLRISASNTSLDDTIGLWLQTVTDECEHQLQRALITQAWRLKLDDFPDTIELAYGPVISITSIQYYDVDNVLQTLDPGAYVLNPDSVPGTVKPEEDFEWPETRPKASVVIVEYSCGYGPTDATVPAGAKQYILARLAEQFDPATKEFSKTVQSEYLPRLLDRHRVY